MARGGAFSKLSRKAKRIRSAGSLSWPGSGGGGGDEETPAWARPGSIADIDFVNDPPRAWTSTGGEVAFAAFNTILGESLLIPDRAYDPADVNAGVGYIGSGTFIGDFVDAFAFDFTVVIEHDEGLNMEFTEGTFGTDLVYRYGTVVAPGLLDNGSESTGYVLTLSGNGTEGSHVSAFTITAASMYGGCDGVAFMSDEEPPTSALDPSTPNDPTDVVFQASALIRRLTVYPAKNESATLALTA
jgi:hypothetical protein